MLVRRVFQNSTSVIQLLILLVVSPCTQALAAPSISIVNGSISEGSTITINGSDFGANGPTIVIFDNFDGGANGEEIYTGYGSATVGEWDDTGGGDDNNPPVYSNSYKVSGELAMRGDFTVKTSSGTDSSSNANVQNLHFTEAFLSYWFFLPTTSEFPGSSDDNWKLGWFVYTPGGDEDLLVFEMLGASGEKDIGCNNCYIYGSWPNRSNYVVLQPNFTFQKGSWYRVQIYVKGTYDDSGKRQLWTLSPDESMELTQRMDWTGRQWNEEGNYWNKFILNPWARWCDGCNESYGFFDDAYLATGPYARARVEIGNAESYDSCTNLSICTVTSWQDNSITATVRQGSFSSLESAYLYITDADGTVNTNGYPITVGGTGSEPPSYQCSDGADNDGDGLVDYPEDPGCSSTSDNDEYNAPPQSYQCSDGVDNDGDGLIDYPEDPGCLSTSDNDEYDAPPSNTDEIIEAESGNLTSPIQTVSSSEASGHAYIQTETAGSGTATYTINIETADSYKIIARVYAVDQDHDSFYVQIDGNEEILWDLNPTSNPDEFDVWREDEVTSRGTGTYNNPEYDPYIIELTQGLHTITISGRESNARLDYFYFSRESDIPSNTPPLAPSGLKVSDP
jgi:hypothetical protein